MLNKIKLGKKKFSDYKQFISKSELKSLQAISRQLRGKKIIHINSTNHGGGVAEMLQSIIPLFNSLNVSSDWYTFNAPNRFFEITKQIHNGLQGGAMFLSLADKKYYLKINRQLAQEIGKLKADILVAHDPQPLAAISFLSRPSSFKKIFRIHIDLSKPNLKVLSFVSPYLKDFDAIIMSNLDYVNPKIDYNKINIFYPAIDPLAIKNKALNKKQAKMILKRLGINPDSPLISQISRFDPWKDPLGVIDVYKSLKRKWPNLQLVYLGLIQAKDDPQAFEYVDKTIAYAGQDKNIHLFSDINQLAGFSNEIVVNALQVASDVILQKSLREGFGLTVTEAMWKKAAVVAGNVGGIRLQIIHGQNGFLVNNQEQAVIYVHKFLADKKLRQRMGRQAKKSVKEKFLITRLMHDYLKLFKQIL